MSAEIDDLRLRPFELVQVECFADGQDAVAFDGDGLLPFDGSERSMAGTPV